ncbi:hypothetical protein M1N05_00630, partial [Dehalococcoidales bacterium]|nr:hypothetical protein [Dehalococcoidales bacterium]
EFIHTPKKVANEIKKRRVTKMKLRGIKNIALLVVAVLLLTTPLVAVARTGGIDEEEFRMDARYWWEVPPLTPYQRQQVKEIMVHIFDHYFQTDVSSMSPKEFEELGVAIGHEKQREVLRLFGHYAKKRGFEVPAGMPIPREEFIPPAEVSYWWELVDPEFRESAIAMARQMFPEVDVMRLTPEEYELLINPPPPPLRLVPIEEKRERPGTVAVYGTARAYSSQAEIREWLDKLREVRDLIIPIWSEMPAAPYNLFFVSPDGYLVVGLNEDKLTIDEALPLVPEIYAVIAEKAKTLGIQDVPVAFSLAVVGLDTATSLTAEVVALQTTSQPGYGERYRPIVGGIMMQGLHRGIPSAPATIAFAVRDPIAWWWDDIDYAVTGHFGEGET